ncbi:universal stress protein [Paracoccaceae bacterium GXU_MW_L88]
MRKFLVVMDESDEWVNALHFAALRAERTHAGVEVLAVIQSENLQHFMGVADVMRAEAEEEIEDKFREHTMMASRATGITPILNIREGEPVKCLLKLIEEKDDIGILVLAASSKDEGPGPLIQGLIAGRHAGKVRVPVTVVPAGITMDELRKIC